MTAIRLLPLATHSALELLLGMALIAAPFALGLSTPAMVAGVVIGAVLVGLALQAVDPGTYHSVAAHHAADHGLALGLAAAAALLWTTDATAGILFGLAAVLQVSLNLTTRYTAR